MMMFFKRYLVCLVLAISCVVSAAPAYGEGARMLFDFREGAHGWFGNPRVTNLDATEEGLSFASVGVDPWIEGPVVENLPTGNRVRITLRMKSTGDPAGELFYGATFVPQQSQKIFVSPDGEWHEYSVILPALEPGTRLRIDPSHDVGTFVIAWIKAEPLVPLAQPTFEKPNIVQGRTDAEVRSGGLSFSHDGVSWDGYVLSVDENVMAMGHSGSELGVLVDGAPMLIPLNHDENASFTFRLDGDGIGLVLEMTDREGVQYRFSRRVEPLEESDALRMVTTLEADADRELFHLPWVTLFPGLGTFGDAKNQALLPGVEYLEDEPSSSEADFNAEQAERRIVEDYKITLPMMALQHEGRYMGLAWNRKDRPAAVFDSPDRVFHSGAHLMGLWHPGVGGLRLENDFAAMSTFPLKKDTPLTFEVVLFGGRGESVVDAVKKYVAIRGIPDVPEFEGGLARAVELLAAGWMDTPLHEDGLWRHALWGDVFGPVPAADAPAYMHWLAAHTGSGDLGAQLRAAAAAGLQRLNPPDDYARSVSHVKSKAPVLLFGSIENNVERMVAGARDQLSLFDDAGLRRYQQPDPERPDYGRTHFADHANGYGGATLETILSAAVFSGDKALTEAGLSLLEKQTAHYENTVPRGAQTWEMPLHTPDILGSAVLIRTYVLGYLLTGNDAYLEQARYWAWTGVPFLYLDYPVDGELGLYATIAVLGATNWVAPNWVGQPVQWCGLVYSSALYDLAQVDNKKGAFWEQLAKGVTWSGLEQTFPMQDEERKGLLPDYLLLREQFRDGPAINPGTVQARIPEVFGRPALYNVVRIGLGDMLVHAPGSLSSLEAVSDGYRVRVRPWSDTPYWVRITHAVPDSVSWEGKAILEMEIDEQYGAINLRVSGDGILVLKQ